MQVKEVMSKEVIVVRRSTTLKQLLETFAKFHIFPLVPVVEEGNLLVGIVSFRSIIDAIQPYRMEILKMIPFLDEDEENIFNMEYPEEIGTLVIADDIMEKRFISVDENATLEEAYKLMKLNLKEEFPVVNASGRLVGMIGIFDIIRGIFHQKGVF